MRSVTIWFQNRRQTDRRIRRYDLSPNTKSTEYIATGKLTTSPNSRPRFTATSDAPERADHVSHSRGHMCTSALQLFNTRRPSLDHIASRMEREREREFKDVRCTPTARGSSFGSSLIDVDREHELLDFFDRCHPARLTLEWVCAAARVFGLQSDDEDGRAQPFSRNISHVGTDDIDVEAGGAPPERLIDSGFNGSLFTDQKPVVSIRVYESDVVEAALALCRLAGHGHWSG